MSRRTLTCLVAAAIILSIAAPGLADRTSLHDRNDAYGRLDVKTIAHAHAGPRKLVHRIVTFGTWNDRSLSNDGTFIHILFTTDSDNRPERVMVINEQGGHLVAAMHAWRNGVGAHVYGHGHATRPNRRSVRIVFDRDLLGAHVTEYGWHVSTQFHQNGHPHCGSDHKVVVVCPDSAPNGTSPYAYLRHQL